MHQRFLLHCQYILCEKYNFCLCSISAVISQHLCHLLGTPCAVEVPYTRKPRTAVGAKTYTIFIITDQLTWFFTNVNVSGEIHFSCMFYYSRTSASFALHNLFFKSKVPVDLCYCICIVLWVFMFTVCLVAL